MPKSLHLASAVLLCMLFGAGKAHAVRKFPQDIQKQLNLHYTPPCSVCHVENNTGKGTAVTPLAYSMRARGLSSSDRNSVGGALSRLEQDQTDSDEDGLSDVDELVAGTDPNSAANSPLSGETEPLHGCNTARGVGSVGDTSLAVLAAGILAVTLGRRRRTW